MSVPKLRFPEFRDAGEWDEKKLEELLEFKNGINASKEQYGKGTKFINVLDILQNEFITYEKIIGSVDVSDAIVDKFSVNYGDILFQRSSETQEEVGTASVYLDRNKTATFGGFVIRGKKIGEYEPIFLNKLLKSQSIRSSISSKSGGSTRFNIGQENLSSIKIFLPSIQEQQKIADCLSSIDQLITAETQKLDTLKAHKKGLMQQLFPALEEVKK
jgi:type I restriction enzyme, S subunit